MLAITEENSKQEKSSKKKKYVWVAGLKEIRDEITKTLTIPIESYIVFFVHHVMYGHHGR